MKIIYEISDPLNIIEYKGTEIISKTSTVQSWCILNTEGCEHLFINNTLQSSKADEHMYHETFVHSLMSGCKKKSNVLILGGSEGCMLREVLKWDVEKVTQVDWDETLITYFKGPGASWNSNSYDDPRVSVIISDAFEWLKSCTQTFDCIFIDLFDPTMISYHFIYSIIKECKKLLSPSGGLSVNAGSINSKASGYLSIFLKDLFDKEFAALRCPVPSFKEDWVFLMILPKLWSCFILENDLPCTSYYNRTILIDLFRWEETLYPALYNFSIPKKLTEQNYDLKVDIEDYYGC
jgi:spermidine synthase